jgi:hypothetical protein
MPSITNIELIQDNYTDIIVYDGSDRTDVTYTWIALTDITGITVTFLSTSEHLDENKTYTFDDDQTGKHVGNVAFTGYNFSAYDAAETLTFTVNGIDNVISVDDNMTTAALLAAEIDLQLTSTDVTVSAVGNYIKIETNNTGSDEEIEITGGTMLDRIGWRVGIYRGNDILWGDPALDQTDMRYIIYPEDMDFEGEFPEGYWNISVTTYYNDGTPNTYTQTYTEYTYKQTELYRAQVFEKIAKYPYEYSNIEQRAWTTEEQWMYKMIHFDAIYKSFLASLEVGNQTVASNVLDYLIDFQDLNAIT